MKILLVTIGLAMTASVIQAGSWSGQRYGNIEYWHGPDGANYTGQHFGNITYWHGYDANGQYHSATSQRFGNLNYYNDDQD